MMRTAVTDVEQQAGSTNGAAVAKPIRILLVEDDATIAHATERLIRRSATGAVEIVHVTSGEDAMLAIAAGFELVVSDYNLAGAATGADVLAFVRTLPSPPAFLFVSGDDRIASLGAPWLAKPCRPSELRDAVLRLIEPVTAQLTANTIMDERRAPRIHYSGTYPEAVDMECPWGCGQVPVAIRPDPYFTTHRSRSGEECAASRCWVSRRSVDARCAEILNARRSA